MLAQVSNWTSEVEVKGSAVARLIGVWGLQNDQLLVIYGVQLFSTIRIAIGEADRQ